MYLLIYMVFGVVLVAAVLVVLVAAVLALHARLKTDALMLMRATTAFGLIWAGSSSLAV
jgi:hypothetical protein